MTRYLLILVRASMLVTGIVVFSKDLPFWWLLLGGAALASALTVNDMLVRYIALDAMKDVALKVREKL